MVHMLPLEQFIKDNLDDPELEQKIELFKMKMARQSQKPGPKHGTLYMYTRLKCKCDECRAVWAEYQRVRR